MNLDVHIEITESKNSQNSEAQNGPRRGLDFIALVEWMGRNFDVFPGFQEISCYA